MASEKTKRLQAARQMNAPRWRYTEAPAHFGATRRELKRERLARKNARKGLRRAMKQVRRAAAEAEGRIPRSPGTSFPMETCVIVHSSPGRQEGRMMREPTDIIPLSIDPISLEERLEAR